MFRLVDRPLSLRQRASEWIYKMLFLWSREPVPNPRAGPWFAWLATALVLWRCRRGITKTILAASPLRLIRKRPVPPPVSSCKTTTTESFMKRSHRRKQRNPILQRKYRKVASIRRRAKRFCTGDGPHVSNSTPMIPSAQQIYYRVTRSGKVYGKYPNKVATATNTAGQASR